MREQKKVYQLNDEQLLPSTHWKTLRDNSFNEFVNKKKIEAKTANQSIYIKSVINSIITICTGPAGTGKTYLACGLAAQMFKTGKIERIILSRPLAECDEEIGTLPGTLEEKVSDTMKPMMEHLKEFFNQDEMLKLIKEERIIIVPLAKMRGSTFKKSFIILDEAQNATFRQLKMFLTRLGEGSKVVVCGDYTQSDLKWQTKNSLLDVVERFNDNCHKNISIVRLGREDIVRHELIQWIDERLTDYQPIQKDVNDTDEIPSYHNSWENIVCPKCNLRIYFEKYAKQKKLTLGCCHCNCSISQRKPEGITTLTADYYCKAKGGF